MRAALAAANANRPKGAVEDGDRHWQIYANDQAKTAAEYLPLIVAYRNGAAVQLSDVADVVDSVQDLRNAGMANGKPSVLRHHQPPAQRQHHRDGRPRDRAAAVAARVDSERDRPDARRWSARRRSARRCATPERVADASPSCW